MNRLIKFGIVGAVAAFVHVSALFVLVNYAALSLLLANMLAFIIAFCVSYPGQSRWTFADRNIDHRKGIGRFLSIQLLSNFVINQSLFYLLVSYTELNYLLVCVMVLISVAVITYLLSFYWGLRCEGRTDHG